MEYAHRNSRDLIAMIAAIDPDVVLLTEPGAWWQIREQRLCALERPGHIGSDHFPLLVDVQLQREGSHP